MDNEKISALKEIIKISGKYCPEIIPIIKSILSREYEDSRDILERKARRPESFKIFFNEAYSSYEQLIKSGMFFEFYPNLTGDWKEDCDWWVNNSNLK